MNNGFSNVTVFSYYISGMSSTQSNNPLVTVYIPTRNRRILLERAVDSVLNQSYQNIELIIVNDGSDDDTQDYLDHLVEADNRVKALNTKKSGGANAARNLAISIANGEFITGLDDDDYFLEKRIYEFVEHSHILSNEVVALATSRLQKVGEDSYTKINTFPEIDKELIYLRNFIGSQVFLKTDRILALGGFDPDLPAWQDLELFLRLLDYGSVRTINNFSYVIDTTHIHERISNSNSDRMRSAYQYICQKHNLSARDRRRLEGQLLAYKPTFFGSIYQLAKYLIYFDPIAFRSNAMRLIRSTGALRGK